MVTLTAEGRTAVDTIARRHDVGTDAVDALLAALERGGGRQAQFSHKDLGGMGQWSRGGMIMVGDMFNSRLKERIDGLCNDLSELMTHESMFTASASGSSRGAWWPEGCGQPSASGSQNASRYAYFPDTRRLAIERDGAVTLYDTGDHRISGVSQQQSGTQDLAFTSQTGTVRLHDLRPLGDERAAERSESAPLPGTQPRDPAPKPADTARHESGAQDDVFAKIERLHELQRKGVLSEAEYADKKTELLARI